MPIQTLIGTISEHLNPATGQVVADLYTTTHGPRYLNLRCHTCDILVLQGTAYRILWT